MNCSDPQQSDRIDSFSLVSYIPEPLGDFLTGLRRDLVSECTAHAHVTVLPPRKLGIERDTPAHVLRAVEEDIRERVAVFPPFEIEIAEIKIFPGTFVVYAAIGQGRDTLIEMHDKLNTGRFKADEAYRYSPHVTLAQNIDPEQVTALWEKATKAWESRRGIKFMVECLTFVQNTEANVWVDLTACELRGAVLAGTR
jgi:2'-5' RNA ligase